MKAVRIHENGGLDVLTYEEAPEPQAGPRDALIRVKACALNHLDLFVRRGIPGVTLPHIPGSDVAGVVDALGEGAGGYGFTAGDRVVINPGVSCGECEFCRRGEDSMCEEFHIIGEQVDGGYAELVRVPARNLMHIPEEFPFEEAASAPLVFLTAWRMLINRARVRPGEDVLVLGASGGVGTAAVQIAKFAGARVFAAAGTDEKLQKLTDLGVDVPLNYNRVDFSKEVWQRTNKRGVDVVVENVGEATWEGSLRALTRNGRLVTCGATTGPKVRTDLRRLFWNQLQLIGSTMGTRSEFHHVMGLIWERKLQPVLDRTFPLQEAAEAQKRLENKERFGKIVLVPAD